MKRIDALKKAEIIAKVVKNYSHFFGGWGQGDDKYKEMKAYEIVLFGSVTKKCDDETVNNIDMLVIDNGIYSSGCDQCHLLDTNFLYFVIDLECYLTSLDYKPLEDLAYKMDVNMHVLPLRFFRNKKFREEVKSRHHDPDFFKNVFATAMRWRMGKQFVPVDVSYFERKYKVRLQDLKK